ncbi:hypothetical protein BS47DRAFT_76381 [Hydnum rufescens UP504]|uniref:Uncharacterized protein n=1 Tax=Hydnum rufescens UP504 TaxID=1448309 RepID=A0A9P6E1A7_9AGAM|nr:hypothetical protein BS47DRAFT_76381 [Hydnum rufescens UP504]
MLGRLFLPQAGPGALWVRVQRVITFHGRLCSNCIAPLFTETGTKRSEKAYTCPILFICEAWLQGKPTRQEPGAVAEDHLQRIYPGIWASWSKATIFITASAKFSMLSILCFPGILKSNHIHCVIRCFNDFLAMEIGISFFDSSPTETTAF